MHKLLRGAATLGFFLILLSPTAAAQFSGSLSVVSDYRYRGVSLSDDRPAAQAALAYDHASGAFGGLLASTARISSEAGAGAQVISYAGYARRLAARLAWEGGVQYVAFSRASGLDYPEAFLGMSLEPITARIYYARRYYGSDSAALYGELNALQPFAERFHLFGHVGALRYKSVLLLSAYGVDYRQDSSEMRWDARLGVGADFDSLRLQLSWVARSESQAGYPFDLDQRRHTVVIALSRAF